MASNPIFTYFELPKDTTDKFKAKCRFCSTYISGTLKVTSNFITHMKVRFYQICDVISNNVSLVTWKVSDQPEHKHSLIRAIASHSNHLWKPSNPQSQNLSLVDKETDPSLYLQNTTLLEITRKARQMSC